MYSVSCSLVLGRKLQSSKSASVTPPRTTPFTLLTWERVFWWDTLTVWPTKPTLRHMALNQPHDSVSVRYSPHCVRGTLPCWGDWVRNLRWVCLLYPVDSRDQQVCNLWRFLWDSTFCVAAQRPGHRPHSSLLRPAWNAGLSSTENRKELRWDRTEDLWLQTPTMTTPDQTKITDMVGILKGIIQVYSCGRWKI